MVWGFVEDENEYEENYDDNDGYDNDIGYDVIVLLSWWIYYEYVEEG